MAMLVVEKSHMVATVPFILMGIMIAIAQCSCLCVLLSLFCSLALFCSNGLCWVVSCQEYEKFCQVVDNHAQLLDLTIRNCDTAIHCITLIAGAAAAMLFSIMRFPRAGFETSIVFIFKVLAQVAASSHDRKFRLPTRKRAQ